MENLHRDSKCRSLGDLGEKEKLSRKNGSLTDLLKFKHCDINLSHWKKIAEKDSETCETIENGHCQKAPKNIPFQQKVEKLVENSRKNKESTKPVNSRKIGLFQWFLRFFGVFFVSLRFPADNPIS